MKSEVWVSGRQVDLATPCKTWVIECGDTSPAPIAEHLLHGHHYVAVLPFQGKDMSCLEAIVFSPGEKWDRKSIEQELIIDMPTINGL